MTICGRTEARLLAAALVLDEAAGGQNDREFERDLLVDRRLLNRSADVLHAERGEVRPGRVLRDEVGTRGVDRLAMHGHRVREVPGVGARLAVAVGQAAVGDRVPTYQVASNTVLKAIAHTAPDSLEELNAILGFRSCGLSNQAEQILTFIAAAKQAEEK